MEKLGTIISSSPGRSPNEMDLRQLKVQLPVVYYTDGPLVPLKARPPVPPSGSDKTESICDQELLE